MGAAYPRGMVDVSHELGMLSNSWEVHLLKSKASTSLCGMTGDWWDVYEYRRERLCERCVEVRHSGD